MMEVTIKLYKRVPVTTGTGSQWIPDGTLTGEIQLSVDTAKLTALMGPRALKSKAKKSILADGAIVARAVNLRRTPPEGRA